MRVPGLYTNFYKRVVLCHTNLNVVVIDGCIQFTNKEYVRPSKMMTKAYNQYTRSQIITGSMISMEKSKSSLC